MAYRPAHSLTTGSPADECIRQRDGHIGGLKVGLPTSESTCLRRTPWEQFDRCTRYHLGLGLLPAWASFSQGLGTVADSIRPPRVVAKGHLEGCQQATACRPTWTMSLSAMV